MDDILAKNQINDGCDFLAQDQMNPRAQVRQTVAPPPKDSQPCDMPGTLVDNRFRILERIGDGGMATIYRAQQLSVEREVAIKLIKRKYRHSQSIQDRFRREAALASQLNHPNSVTIYDLGECPEHGLYIAMELIKGIDLKREIDKFKKISWRRACRLGIQLCNALQNIHNNNIVHRDIKPSNIMLTYHRVGDSITQVVKVLDFGLATGAAADEAPPSSEILGTPEYMSPETVLGVPLDHRSDIYSLGIVMYKMLTGEYPFRERTPIMVMNHHLNGRPRSFKEIDRDLGSIPKGLEELVMWMLKKDRKERPDSMNAVATLLNSLQKDRKRGFPGFTPSRGIDVRRINNSETAPRGVNAPTVPIALQKKPEKTLPSRTEDGEDEERRLF